MAICRHTWIGCACVALLLPGTAFAGSMAERLDQANGHLRSGDAKRALELYREVQVDHPDEDRVIFGIGCAQYDQAALLAKRAQSALPAEPEAEAETEATPGVTELYDAAADSFGRLAASPAPELRADAAFNRGNCQVGKAAFLETQAQRDGAVAAYREAIATYEALLKEAPEHAGARTNLDHARYKLKQLLRQEQEEPEEQEKPKSLFLEPRTELPGARVEVPEDAPTEVRLITKPEGAGP